MIYLYSYKAYNSNRIGVYISGINMIMTSHKSNMMYIKPIYDIENNFKYVVCTKNIKPITNHKESKLEDSEYVDVYVTKQLLNDL